jgi:hypothetical protein
MSKRSRAERDAEDDFIRRHRHLLLGGGGFNPASVLSWWLRNDTVGAISTVPDLLNTNPATSVTTLRPTGNADGSMTFDGGDRLVCPIIAAHGTATRTGAAFWYKPASVTGTQCLWGMTSTGGASSGPRFELEQSGADLRVRVHLSTNAGTDRRLGTVASVFTIGVPVFLYFGYNGLGATDALKCFIAADTTFRTVTFSQEVATAAAMPAALQVVTGNFSLGGRGGATNQIQAGGMIGRNVYGPADILTLDQFLNLKALEPLAA